MRILIAHNDYAKRSGEEAVVEKMHRIFEELGHEVRELRMSTAGMRDSLLGKMRGFIAGVWSPKGVRAMRDILDEYKPDLVNVHNLYPFISPAALFECRKRGIPVVMTIHNFRLICPTGLFMRDGAPCELCLERGDEWGCLRHNCEGSRLKSLGYAARNAVARRSGAFRECVSHFACITGFQRDKLIAAGFDAVRISVIPNSIDMSADAAVGPGEYVGYCGRISREKGVDMIISVARRHPHIPFRIAGAVRDLELVAELPSNVELTGFLSGHDLEDFYANSRFMVMASRWYEGFPMSILEAGQHGRATIGPAHGGFTEILEQDDLLFTPGDEVALELTLTRLWNVPGLAQQQGARLRTKVSECYSSENVTRKWNELIRKLTACRKN